MTAIVFGSTGREISVELEGRVVKTFPIEPRCSIGTLRKLWDQARDWAKANGATEVRYEYRKPPRAAGVRHET